MAKDHIALMREHLKELEFLAGCDDCIATNGGNYCDACQKSAHMEFLRTEIEKAERARVTTECAFFKLCSICNNCLFTDQRRGMTACMIPRDDEEYKEAVTAVIKYALTRSGAIVPEGGE